MWDGLGGCVWVCLLGTSEVLLVLGIVRPKGLVPLLPIQSVWSVLLVLMAVLVVRGSNGNIQRISSNVIGPIHQ